MKTAVMVVGGYFLLVAGASYYSNSSSDTTPTADMIAGLPSFSNPTINAVVGVGLLMFSGKVAATLARV